MTNIFSNSQEKLGVERVFEFRKMFILLDKWCRGELKEIYLDLSKVNFVGQFCISALCNTLRKQQIIRIMKHKALEKHVLTSMFYLNS